jgi:DNA repair exonuclease SbcCD ATPase subunit
LEELLNRGVDHPPPHPNKIIFSLLQLKEQVNQVKAQHLHFRSTSAATLESSKRWAIKQTSKLAQQLLEYKVECESCQHELKYESNKKNGCRSKGTVDPRAGKDLKSLNERYKLIKEQN